MTTALPPVELPSNNFNHLDSDISQVLPHPNVPYHTLITIPCLVQHHTNSLREGSFVQRSADRYALIYIALISR